MVTQGYEDILKKPLWAQDNQNTLMGIVDSSNKQISNMTKVFYQKHQTTLRTTTMHLGSLGQNQEDLGLYKTTQGQFGQPVCSLS